VTVQNLKHKSTWSRSRNFVTLAPRRFFTAAQKIDSRRADSIKKETAYFGILYIDYINWAQYYIMLHIGTHIPSPLADRGQVLKAVSRSELDVCLNQFKIKNFKF
jgi:hypothetical protein